MRKVLSVLGAAAKAAAGAVAPFLTVWATTGTIDYRALIGAVVGALLVYFVPNLKPSEIPAVDASYSPGSAGHPDPLSAPAAAPAATPAPAAPSTPPAAS